MLDQHGQPDFQMCGVMHRTLKTAERCAERHTRSLRSQPGYAHAAAFAPVERKKGWARWVPIGDPEGFYEGVE